MTSLKLLPVPDSLIGERADAALAKMMGLSRSAAADLLADGHVLLNGKTIGKSDRLVVDGYLEVSMPTPKTPLAIVPVEVPGFKIVYQDDDIIVVDKPAGVAAHPSVGWDGPTVPGALLALGIQISTSGAQERQGIVQRLDVGTSGLMTLAKSEIAYSRLKQAFRDRAVHKVYHAVIQGHPDPLSGTFDAPIGRHPKAEFKFAVMNDGKHSVTHYETLEAFPAASLVEVVLETGRTHQIRVHFSAFRHPLVGDTMYGADPKLAAKLNLDRQWLHAMRLSFEHPTQGRTVEFTSEYPADLAHALEVLRAS
ncbi:RluA family pseudouridine synthase [Rhodoluna sp. KAS3]|uniref:RluA family pseudouridine synthase n=1 Tax=Rhodoluna sp. KAS3 TaxID=942880 RepID=UPI002231251F|nr:RluA family pseudouridine synthase [Rhodoluna sp. KAS3]BDS48930.1 pseudouridine synthase [Rhodoluna sp. KAS3]